MPYPRKYGIHRARAWRTFPFFGWHVVKYPRGGGHVKISWHLNRDKAAYIAWSLQRAEYNDFYRGN